MRQARVQAAVIARAYEEAQSFHYRVAFGGLHDNRSEPPEFA